MLLLLCPWHADRIAANVCGCVYEQYTTRCTSLIDRIVVRLLGRWQLRVPAGSECDAVAARLNDIVKVIESDGCNSVGTMTLWPEYSCKCNDGIQGTACDSDISATREAKEFVPFYYAAGSISAVTFLGSACYAYDSHAAFLKVLLFAAFVTLRIFDTMSDWAMCLISLKSDRFTLKSTYGTETGDGTYPVLQKVALAFTIIGTLLLVLDLVTLRRRAAAWFSKTDALDGEERKSVGKGMGAIVLLEDTPQLAIAVVYLISVDGFSINVDADDTVVMLSLALSILSLLANGWMAVTFTCSSDTVEA